MENNETDDLIYDGQDRGDVDRTENGDESSQIVSSYEQVIGRFGTDYQDGIHHIEEEKSFPWWTWLSIPIALAAGIVLVLVYGPKPEVNPDLNVPIITERPIGVDTKLPLAQPAGEGQFRVNGLTMYQGLDDTPVNPGDIVEKYTRLTFKLEYEGAQYEEKVDVEWFINDEPWSSDIVNINPWTTTIDFTKDLPEGGWPDGSYRVIIKHDGVEESSIFFQVGVQPDDTFLNENGDIVDMPDIRMSPQPTEEMLDIQDLEESGR